MLFIAQEILEVFHKLFWTKPTAFWQNQIK